MEIRHAIGVEGAREASGIVVVIDVLRAFTLSAYAFAGGARECLLAETVEQARELASTRPGAVVSAEVDTLPVPGIPISNSPTQIRQAELRGRTVVQRTSAGTPVINAVREGHEVYASSLVVATATAQACLLRPTQVVTLVASGDFPEDHACARFIAARLRGETANLDDLMHALYDSDRYRRLNQGDWPGFPRSDLELALVPDRFDFAMRARRMHGSGGPGHIRLTMQTSGNNKKQTKAQTPG